MKTARSMLRVSTLQALRERHSLVCREKEVTPHLDPVTEIHPVVNHGRWVATCPWCNGGFAVSPEWAESGCMDCGAWFERLVFPADVAAIDRVLAERPTPNQNWLPGETVDRLLAENAEHASQLRRRRTP